MDTSLYSHSLCLSLPLMLFFGLHMLFARTPEKQVYIHYLRSRRLMGTALLILAANYSVHLFGAIRLRDTNATILLNLATYFLCYWLFSAALMTLLDHRYLSRRRTLVHMGMWLTFTALACVVARYFAHSRVLSWGTLTLAAWLVGYGLFLSIRVLRTYTRAIRMFADTHSDDLGAYIRWLSIFTHWALAYGVSCGLLTFLPDRYVFVWILTSIPFYIYLYCCYHNYMLFYEQVEHAFEQDHQLAATDDDLHPIPADEDRCEIPAYHPDMARRVSAWIDSEGYRQPGITLHELSLQLCTNRTYLSQYINSVCQMSFRDWITSLRIDYAKRLMLQQPQLKVQEIAAAAGFLSLSHFTRTFSAREGCSPAKWRDGHTAAATTSEMPNLQIAESAN